MAPYVRFHLFDAAGPFFFFFFYPLIVDFEGITTCSHDSMMSKDVSQAARGEVSKVHFWILLGYRCRCVRLGPIGRVGSVFFFFL